MDYSIELTGAVAHKISENHYSEMTFKFTVLTTADNVFDAMKNGQVYLSDMFKYQDKTSDVYVEQAIVRRSYE